jgi:protein-disulfide isomerase
MTRHALARSLFGALLVSTACARSEAPKPSASPAAPSASAEVVAQIDGVPILGRDLDERAERRLSRLRQEEYEIRSQALEEMISERLLEKEAKTRGITTEGLLRDEVDQQLPEPDPKLVAELYEQNKARFPGKTKDEVGVEIRKALKDRARAERRADLQRRLRAKSKVEVALQAPRTDMPVPAAAPVLGPNDAPVTIVQFTDYQCPFCHRAQATIDAVMSRYAGKVQLVHRDFPLDGHPQAFPAARAARCAGEQGKFWDYYRSLMTSPGSMADADLRARATTLKLDPAAFTACLSSDRNDAVIRESVEAGIRAGVSGTPAYFINGRMITGARPFEAFQEIIEGELNHKG